MCFILYLCVYCVSVVLYICLCVYVYMNVCVTFTTCPCSKYGDLKSCWQLEHAMPIPIPAPNATGHNLPRHTHSLILHQHSQPHALTEVCVCQKCNSRLKRRTENRAPTPSPVTERERDTLHTFTHRYDPPGCLLM